MSSYTVEAILTARTSQFTAGMREAMESVEKFKSTTTSLSAIGDAFMDVGNALTAGITAPVAAGVTAIIKSYADLEQAVGGVETLFKDSAATVIANSETAYTRAGVSGVKYMEQVTSFSATLLQGLGGDTAQAAAYGDKAVVQMADNANKMGTAIGDIQNAYQGFAKDNYTMLDNLKLGYGGTQSEMARLVNESGVLNGAFEATAENVKDIPFHTLIEAIGVTQDRLGITGTTAKEASGTVSGSFQAMVAAGQNLVAGFGAADADVQTLMNNLKSTVEIFAQNIKRVLKNIWDNLPMAEWQKWVLAIAVGAGPVLLAIGGIIKAVSGIGSVFKTVGAVMANPFGLALVAIAALVAGFIYAYKHSETFRNMVNSAVESVKKKFNELKTMAQPAIDAIVNSLKKLNVGAFAPLIGGVGLAILALKKLKGFEFSKLFKFKFPAFPNPFTKLTGFAKSAGLAVEGVFSGLGKSISAVFKGVGSSIATVFRGLAQSISMLNPVGVASFALGVAAVTVALVALSSVQGMVLPFLQGFADILVSLVGGVLQAFAQAIVTMSPVMITLAAALSMLSPLIVAVGQAFATAAPFVTALGDAISAVVASVGVALPPIIAALGSAISQIATAITPIVGIISSAFVQIVTVVSNAIVQIIQALAPFIPAITEMVVAVAPVLSQIVEAFNNLISQISPIIDSISNLFKTLGEQISNILNSAKGVITGFGDAVRNVLDGVAGIFESMGNAALNAGKGVKEMAQGIKILVDLKLGDLAATLATTASGLGKMASHASGMSSLGTAMTQVGTGMTLFATSSVLALTSLTAFGTAITTLKTNLTQLPATMTSASVGFQTFATQAVSGVAGLSAVNAPIATFKAQIMTLTPAIVSATAGFTMFSTRAMIINGTFAVIGGLISTFNARILSISTATSVAGSSFGALAGRVSVLSGALSSISGGFASVGASASSSASQMSTIISATQSVITAFNSMRSQIQSSMQTILTIMLSIGNQMKAQGRTIGQQTSQNIAQGISSGVGRASSAMNALISAVRSAGMSGVGSMRSIGAYIGQGLASGMMSALGSVTAAANALVAQAERAAQAKAKIHSPSRLFRDNVGIYIGQGVAVGIERSQKYVDSAMDSMFDRIDNFNAQVSDMMSSKAVYDFDGGRFSNDIEITYRNQDDAKLDTIREALDTIKSIASRDTVLNVNGREFARATGDDISDYQSKKQEIKNLVWGLGNNG